MNFEQTIRAAGLHPLKIVADGRIRRVIEALNVRDLLRYEPDTGLMFWRVHVSKRVRAGSPAGCPGATGGSRLRIGFGKQTYYVHRVAWLYMTGSWPGGEIDHIDGDPTNNRWDNLRDVDRSTNAQNLRRATRRNKSGLLGVHADGEQFAAFIGKDGKTNYLGRFDTAEEAHAAYLAAKRAKHQGCTI